MPEGLECVSGIRQPVSDPVDAGPPRRGNIEVLPDAVDFGAFDFGTVIERRITVKNIGDAELFLRGRTRK